jgi:hypothetical protein
VIPLVGIGLANDEAALSAEQVALLSALDLDHLRVDLDLQSSDWPRLLDRAASEAAAMRCHLELALFVAADAAPRQLEALAAALPTDPPVVRALLHDVQEPVTPTSLVEVARRCLPESVLVTGATDAYFAQLNAFRPPAGVFDALAYPITPQVHAFDEASLVESLAAQADTVATACSFAGGSAIVVSPVTLRPRFNPDATEPTSLPREGELPANVDPRQMSLFGAAWTLGSLKHLTESGVSAVTYFETVGWRGLLETDSTRARAPFPSEPSMVFPLYHVFTELAAWRGAVVVDCRSSHPLTAEGLFLRRDDGELGLIANFTSRPVSVVLSPLPEGRTATIRTLDESTVRDAMFELNAFCERQDRQTLRTQDLTIELAPFAVARLELSAGNTQNV